MSHTKHAELEEVVGVYDVNGSHVQRQICCHGKRPVWLPFCASHAFKQNIQPKLPTLPNLFSREMLAKAFNPRTKKIKKEGAKQVKQNKTNCPPHDVLVLRLHPRFSSGPPFCPTRSVKPSHKPPANTRGLREAHRRHQRPRQPKSPTDHQVTTR